MIFSPSSAGWSQQPHPHSAGPWRRDFRGASAKKTVINLLGRKMAVNFFQPAIRGSYELKGVFQHRIYFIRALSEEVKWPVLVLIDDTKDIQASCCDQISTVRSRSFRSEVES